MNIHTRILTELARANCKARKVSLKFSSIRDTRNVEFSFFKLFFITDDSSWTKTVYQCAAVGAFNSSAVLPSPQQPCLDSVNLSRISVEGGLVFLGPACAPTRRSRTCFSTKEVYLPLLFNPTRTGLCASIRYEGEIDR